MPISKHGNLYFTDKQHDFARYETSALEYALSQGYPLIKKGLYYHHKEHDSMVFSAKTGMWFWNSRQLRGGAIDFITQYEHRSYVEAVLILNGENIQVLQNQPIQKDDVRKQAPDTVEEKKEFMLPSQNQNYARVFAYLLKERKLDPDLVSALVKDKKIFESAEHHNAVFVGYDEHGVPRNAYQRGTNSFMDKPFKRDVAGSDKQYPFHMLQREKDWYKEYYAAFRDEIRSVLCTNQGAFESYQQLNAEFPQEVTPREQYMTDDFKQLLTQTADLIQSALDNDEPKAKKEKATYLHRRIEESLLRIMAEDKGWYQAQKDYLVNNLLLSLFRAFSRNANHQQAKNRSKLRVLQGDLSKQARRERAKEQTNAGLDWEHPGM